MKTNQKIDRSKEMIKKEREKIKLEKQKRNREQTQKFYNTKFGKIIKKLFFLKEHKEDTQPITIKEQIFSMLYFELIGFVLCLLVLFALSGGKNFIKLYAELNKLINVYAAITEDYYGDLNKEELVDKAIESMLNSVGDNYTTYTDKDSTNTFLENINGTYEGIGCMVAMDENQNIFVASVFDNGPAQEAGLKENDVILKIGDQEWKDKTSEDLANYIKENKNPKIKLTIQRKEEIKEITLTRKKVEVPSVTSRVIEQDNKKIGYIDISIFSSVTTEQFKKQLTALEKQKIQGLVIDVRNDTGGYLSTVTDIANLFLKKGQVIYQLEGDKKTEKIKDTTREKRDYPVAVLVNAASASASEILASAIKESYKGYIVGTRTYGKGTVQKTKKLADGSMIKYTIQKWLTPDGNWIQEKGVEPTNFIEYLSGDTEDGQLNLALELITKDLK